jgi:hypothetical protein
MYSKIFKTFTSNDDSDSAFKKFSQQIRDRRTYLSLVKNSDMPGVDASNQNNHLF